MVEVLAAGPAAAERRQIVHRRFAELLKAIYAQARAQHMGMPTLGDHVFVALVGAINELVVDALARGPVDPDALLPLVLDVELSLLGLDARGGG
jgi:hypothetical protein